MGEISPEDKINGFITRKKNMNNAIRKTTDGIQILHPNGNYKTIEIAKGTMFIYGLG